MNSPSANGHDGTGRFVAGNPGGRGNPHAGQVAKLRAVMLEAVTEDDMQEVVLKLVELARGGDLKAIQLLFDRTLGKLDAGPLVAMQANVGIPPASGKTTAAAIIERVRRERLAKFDSEPITVENLEQKRAELLDYIDAMSETHSSGD